MLPGSARRTSEQPADKRRPWLIGGAIVGALLLSGAVVSDAVANLTEAGAPDMALRFKPTHSRALETVATATIERDPVAARRYAEQAYRRDATRAGALRVLGLAQAVRGEERRATLIMRDVERLTRRDLPTQLFFIESAVSRGDVAGALGHFDVAMRTSRSGRALLVPILCDALQDRGLVQPIAQMLNAVPEWLNEFVNGCSDQPASRPALARVLTIAGKARRASPRVATSKTAQLVTLAGDISGGRRLYDALLRDGGRVPSAGLADPRFRVIDGVAPFDWTYLLTPALGAEQGGAGASGLDVHANGRAGVVAWQMTQLRAGKYRLAMTGTSAVPRSGARLAAEFACGSGAQQALGGIRAAGSSRFAAQGSVTVPADCPHQWIRVSLDGGEGGSYEGHVDGITLEPLPNAARMRSTAQVPQTSR